MRISYIRVFHPLQFSFSLNNSEKSNLSPFIRNDSEFNTLRYENDNLIQIAPIQSKQETFTLENSQSLNHHKSDLFHHLFLHLLLFKFSSFLLCFFLFRNLRILVLPHQNDWNPTDWAISKISSVTAMPKNNPITRSREQVNSGCWNR